LEVTISIPEASHTAQAGFLGFYFLKKAIAGYYAAKARFKFCLLEKRFDCIVYEIRENSSGQKLEWFFTLEKIRQLIRTFGIKVAVDDSCYS
jgi:hypothetical protein